MLHAVMATLVSVLVLAQQPQGSVTSTDLPKPGSAAAKTASPVRTTPAAPNAPIVQVPSKVVQAPREEVAPNANDNAEPVAPVEEGSQPQPDVSLAAPAEQAAPAQAPPTAAPVVEQPARPRSLRDEPRPPSTKPVAAFWMILPDQR
jgi:hypothetical protein